MPLSTTGGLVADLSDLRPGSFAALHTHLSPQVIAWAEFQLPREVRGWISPDELAQEVWVRAWTNFDSFDRSKGRFRAWLFGIAYKALRNELREGHRRRSRLQIEPLPDTLVEMTSVVGQVSRRLDLERLRQALDDLSAADRLIAVYRGLEGLSHQVVASRVGSTPDAVEARWRRMRPRLKPIAKSLRVL